MDVRAQDLLDACDEPAAVLAGTGVIVAANAAWRGAPFLAGRIAGDVLHTLHAALVAGCPHASGTYSAGAGEERRDFRFDAAPLSGTDGYLVRRIETTRSLRAEASSERLGARLAAVLDASPDAIVTIDAGGVVRDVNRALTTLFGYEPDEIVGRDVALLLPREAWAASPGLPASLAAGGARIIGRERIVRGRRKDGTPVSVHLTLREARAGGERFFVGLMRDVDEAERQREALDRSTLGFELALEAGGLGSFDVTLATREITGDHRFREAFGIARDAPLACGDVEARLTPEDAERLAEAMREAARGGLLDLEARLPQPDGEDRFVALRGRLVRRDGAAHVAGVVADITARKRAEADRLREERDRLVINEMRHRIKNLFTMVGAILNLSLRGHDDARAYKQAVESRLGALEAAQARLAETGWRTSRLDAIVMRELEPFQGRSRANVVTGCDILIEGHAAQVLSMVVHELATNAAKHGALSVPEGRVRVACACGGNALLLTWKEEGGPPVTLASHRGFGSTVTVRMPERFLGARVELRFDPDGLSYGLAIPKERVIHACD